MQKATYCGGGSIMAIKSVYKVEDRGTKSFGDGTTKFPDFRVVLYVDGEWINEWDGLWTEQQAIEKANLMNKL